MIVFVGQVARDMRDREAFQELNYRSVFGTVAKWATEIDDPARLSTENVDAPAPATVPAPANQ